MQQQVIEALTQAALLESREISSRFAEITAYLEQQQHLAALGTLIGLEEPLESIETLLKTAARISQKT